MENLLLCGKKIIREIGLTTGENCISLDINSPNLISNIINWLEDRLLYIETNSSRYRAIYNSHSL